MKQISVPTDFSEFSGFATQAAMDIAVQTGAELSFLHLLPPRVHPPGDAGNMVKHPARHAGEKLQELVEIAAGQGVKARSRLLESSEFRHLMTAISAVQADIVIMGSRGQKNRGQLLPGSNTRRMLRWCKAPVLVLQQALDSSALSGPIVFASGLEPDTHAAFDKLLSFQKAMSMAPLHFIEITTPNNFRPSSQANAAISNFLSHHKIQDIQTHVYNHFKVESGLIEFSREINASLIAICNHGRSDLSGLFIESIPENLIRLSDIPVFSLRV
jgi:nucleotide-binding universal stress UspA family protein